MRSAVWLELRSFLRTLSDAARLVDFPPFELEMVYVDDSSPPGGVDVCFLWRSPDFVPRPLLIVGRP
jgi:hypothetical protein